MKTLIPALAILTVALLPAQAQEQKVDKGQHKATVIAEPKQAAPFSPARPTVGPVFEKRVTSSGVLADLAKGENLLIARKAAQPYYPAKDLSVDLLTGKPRGVLLFSMNF